MNNEINAIIDSLSSKFGTTSKYLIQEMGKYYVARETVAVIILGLVSVFIIKAIIFLLKKYKEAVENDSYDEDAYFVLAVVFAGFLIGSFIGFMINLVSLVGWIVSPTAATIEMILQCIGGAR